MGEIAFSTCLLYVNDNVASYDFCKKFINTDEKDRNGIKEYNKKYYDFYSSFDGKKGNLWIEIKTGSPLPYADTVFDTEVKTSVPNPRSETQTELRHQVFVLYDCNDKILYISNRNYLEILCFYLRQETKAENIFTKEMIKSIDEFCNTISKIKNIKLVAKNTLFAQTDELFQATTNAFGLGNPKQYKINVTYDAVSITEKFKDKLKLFAQKRKSTEIDSFVCVGNDSEGIEQYFNIDTFGRRIKITVEENDQKMFSGIEVKKILCEKINKFSE